MDLAESGSVGGFFALRTGRPGGGAYVPLARVYAGQPAGPHESGQPGRREPGTLAGRIDRVADRLRTPERRVAASIAHLGLAARLWSVALGPAALYGEVPDLDAEGLFWDPLRTAPDDLVLAAPRTLPASAESVRATVQYGHLVPLAAALRRECRISERLLWGNAGSALAGAARELRLWAAKHGRPEVAERAAALAGELFSHPDLRSTGVLGPQSFRRRSCCLYYRCPGGGLCGDCAFDRPPGVTGLAQGPSAP
ncbi:(2Fe-2S)-binding protein [Streptomyces sp. NPDC051219]|uniref:(2Fe-2S)-binding protein n=1 Tax=Streptomyces sp. NPDC051219 TaxID=3155283 RepID=UPI003418188C